MKNSILVFICLFSFSIFAEDISQEEAGSLISGVYQSKIKNISYWAHVTPMTNDRVFVIAKGYIGSKEVFSQMCLLVDWNPVTMDYSSDEGDCEMELDDEKIDFTKLNIEIFKNNN